eukprot:scaffold7428_cov248-Pinguiococcus_pyrenoidosus.AAC.3
MLSLVFVRKLPATCLDYNYTADSAGSAGLVAATVSCTPRARASDDEGGCPSAPRLPRSGFAAGRGRRASGTPRGSSVGTPSCRTDLASASLPRGPSPERPSSDADRGSRASSSGMRSTTARKRSSSSLRGPRTSRSGTAPATTATPATQSTDEKSRLPAGTPWERATQRGNDAPLSPLARQKEAPA